MSWPQCVHGYNQVPVPGGHHCPWCAGEDTSAYRPVVGKGNGWLLGKDDLACEGCGGPRGAGWGAWSGPDIPTAERVREQLSTTRFCYECVCEGKRTRRTSKEGELLTVDELRTFDAGACPDCGKRLIERSPKCPRLTCGSEFAVVHNGVVRWSNAHPDEPPRKLVEI